MAHIDIFNKYLRYPDYGILVRYTFSEFKEFFKRRTIALSSYRCIYFDFDSCKLLGTAYVRKIPKSISKFDDYMVVNYIWKCGCLFVSLISRENLYKCYKEV